MPAAGRPRSTATQVGCNQRPELDHPAANRLAADLDPALGQQFLYITDAQREPEIQPHRISDHIGRKAMTLKRYRTHDLFPVANLLMAATGEMLALDCQNPVRGE